MRTQKSDNEPTRLLAAQHRVTPLLPRICILRGDNRLTVLTDNGSGLATCDGKRLYGNTDDPLRAPSGVRIWVAEHDRRRLYPTAMPDYAIAEREYLSGRRHVRLTHDEATFFARRDGLEFTEHVRLCDEGEERSLLLRNVGNRPREVTVCVTVEPTFDGYTVRETDAIYRKNGESVLGLRLPCPPEGTQYSGGTRLRVRCPLLLPSDGEWQGTVIIVTTCAPTAHADASLTEPVLLSERTQLCARLYPRRFGAAHIQAIEELLENPPLTDIPLPTVPFFRFELRRKKELPLLQAYLTRLSRWTREGIPTGMVVAYEPMWEEEAKRLSKDFSQIEVMTAPLSKEPLLWQGLCRWDVRRDRRLPARVAVAFTPRPLKALLGGSLRRVPPLPPAPLIVPQSEWLLLQHEGTLISLLHGREGPNSTIVGRVGGLRITIKGHQTENTRRLEMSVTSRSVLPQTLSMAYYIEPQFSFDPQLRELTLSHWEQTSGTLTLYHPLLPDRQLAMTVTGGADSFDCDRAAFWMGEWGSRHPCPMRFPSASITCIRRLPPRQNETVTFEVKAEQKVREDR